MAKHTDQEKALAFTPEHIIDSIAPDITAAERERAVEDLKAFDDITNLASLAALGDLSGDKGARALIAVASDMLDLKYRYVRQLLALYPQHVNNLEAFTAAVQAGVSPDVAAVAAGGTGRPGKGGAQ